VWEYRERNGAVRYAVGHPDLGTRRRHPVTGEKWFTRTAAQRALGELLVDVRFAPSTIASYRKNIRLHLTPRLGDVPLASLTTAAVDKTYRELERGGRADHRRGEGLSPRTVRYIHTILSAALGAAVEAGLLARNPAAKAHPPTARQAKAPEMHPWTAAQLAAFLAWARERGHPHAPAWHVLAHTGMRRGEALALRWRDVDLDADTVSVRRSAGIVRNKGQRGEVTEGPTKTGKPRTVDLDPATAAVLRAHKHQRGTMALALARDDALVFADTEGAHLHPEHFSRAFTAAVRRCRAETGQDVPLVRLHDLRHTHATLLLRDREPLKTVSERLGHASPVVTMTIYGHVLPGDQKTRR
jgi:integrase